jgi:hypothetical protein
MEIRVRDRPLLALLAGPVERDAIAAPRLDVAVNAVVRDVQLAVGEPLVERRVGIIENRRERLGPVERPRLLGPELVRVQVGGLMRLSSFGFVRES